MAGAFGLGRRILPRINALWGKFAPEIAGAARGMEKFDFAPLKILVVGAKSHDILLLKSVLGIAGLGQVIHVEDSRRAIEILCMESIHAVVCDASAAPVDAMALPLAVRRIPSVLNPMLPVFVLQPRARRRDVESARDSGVTDVLTTPLSPRTVMTKLRAALKTPRSFIVAPEFFGPDRRSKARAPFRGSDRRSRTTKKAKLDFHATTLDA
jgi:CheY-like chemotaxis protein